MAADSLSDSSVGIASPSHRLPASTRLGRVQLQVADLARSRAFYEKILGLRVLDMSMDGHAVLGSQEDDTPLVELVERPGAKPSPSRGRLGLFHVAFLLPERAALGRFIRHLAEHGIEPGRSDHRVSEAVYLRDPDGLGIEVYADRPRATWTVDENGQIVMTTEPLNVDDLLRVAGDAAWRGAPAGTTVGHVHLHVGDLGRAAAFYHEALGLDKVVWNYPGALFLSAGGYHHHLGTNTWAGDVPPAREDEAQLLEWTLVVPGPDDVDAIVHSLESASYTASRDGRNARTVDPWGTALRITAAP